MKCRGGIEFHSLTKKIDAATTARSLERRLQRMRRSERELSMNAAGPYATKLKIFVVEDNADTRMLLSYLLEAAGYEVRSAATMQAALGEFPRCHSDVLLSDIGLPDGNGCELLHQLRQRGESPYWIAMSGFGLADDVAASLTAGFRHHLIKPIEMETLEHLLQKAGTDLNRTC